MPCKNSLSTYERAERDAVRAAVGNCAGRMVLNAGCWRDSFLPDVVHAGELTSLRVSELLSRQPSTVPTLGDAADACRRILTFRSDSFDTAISAQLLPHMADRGLRSAYLGEIARVLKPGGRFVVTTMHFNFRIRQKGWPKEGWEGGEYFRRYLPEEFRDELQPCFTVERMHGFWIYLPKTYRLYTALGRASVYWERALRNQPLSLKYGKFLLAVCRPKERKAVALDRTWDEPYIAATVGPAGEAAIPRQLRTDKVVPET